MYSFLHAIQPRQPAAKVATRAVRPGRFLRTLLFVNEGPYPKRGMLYSLLIHAAVASALLSAPPSARQAPDSLQTQLLAFNALPTSSPASGVSSADTIPQLEVLLKKEARQEAAGARCCSLQTTASNLPNPTNRVQTILQPEFADRPSVENFVLLSNVLRLASISLRSTSRVGAPDALPRKSLERDLKMMKASPEGTRPRGDGDGLRNVLALSVVSAPPSEAPPIPMAESRGQSVILAPPNPTASDRGPDDSSISGANSGHTVNPFAGITIQGGEWNRDSHAVQPTGPEAPAEQSKVISHPLTITSAGNSGGGLRDFGVFYNQMVYTNYFEIKRSRRRYAPPFVLQFAVNQSCCTPSDSLTSPHPANEVLPTWPKDVVASYAGEMVVVYGVIADDGKIHEARVLESPSADLNGALLDALAQWTFRPATLNGQPAAATALLGVPVVPSE